MFSSPAVYNSMISVYVFLGMGHKRLDVHRVLISDWSRVLCAARGLAHTYMSALDLLLYSENKQCFNAPWLKKQICGCKQGTETFCIPAPQRGCHQ